MKLGFIGSGKIAASVITGICKSKISFEKILISPRNELIAKQLERKFKKVIIAKNNQEIANLCNWVFLSVTPKVGEKIIKDINKCNNFNGVWKQLIKQKKIYCGFTKPHSWYSVDNSKQLKIVNKI